MDDFLSSSVKDGFIIDTVSINDFQIRKKGISADLKLARNKFTKKYEISVNAHRDSG